jgi:competence protein ComEA
MGVLAVGGTLIAAGIGITGYRDARPAPTPGPSVPESRSALPSGAQEPDPMAPRLFQPAPPIRVHVVGAVCNPDVYSLSAGARVEDAVRRAGGATANADLEAVNLAAPLRDGEQVKIPGRASRPALEPSAPSGEPLSGSGAAAPGSRAGPTAGQLAGPVNLNAAQREELEALPGIGPNLADRIIAYRQEHGPFLRVEDLMNVKGIGPRRWEQLRTRVVAQ